LQFFLGLQIKQSKEGTFVHQAKYTKDIVRKFKMEDSKAMATPMSTTTAFNADEEGEHVDQKEYRSIVSKDFASASGQVHIHVLASHSRLRPLVLRVFFFGASWFFRRGFCWVSVG
jgi:hypothetical protein